MKINIKELFKSDLDPNSVSWWSTDKIDKINYNFNQFANGGPSGPDGLHGQDGIDGIKGNQGPIGAIGAQGFQGITGPLKGTQWNYGENDEGYSYIWPTTDFNGLVAPIIGNSGYIDLSSDYLSSFYDEDDIITGSLIPNWNTDVIGSPKRSGVLNLITEGYTASIDPANNINTPLYSPLGAIEFMEDGQHTRSFNIRLNHDGSGSTPLNSLNFSSKLISSGGPATTDIEKTIFKGGDIEFDTTGNNPGAKDYLGSNSEFNNDIEVNSTGADAQFYVGKIRYSVPGTLFRNVLKQSDGSGKVEWAHINSLVSTYPLGSIIRIPSTFFTEDNFNITTSSTSIDTSSSVKFHSNFGAGKITGNYPGWYLCNSRQWSDGGAKIYNTPDLNAFEWSFNLSTTGVPLFSNYPPVVNIASGNKSKILHSGAISTIGFDSAETANAGYMGSTIDASEESVFIGTFPSGYNAIENEIFGEQVYLVYLGDFNLTWSNVNSNGTLNTISLKYAEQTTGVNSSPDFTDPAAIYLCSNDEEAYEWTSGSFTSASAFSIFWFDDVNFSNTGIRVYKNGDEVETGFFSEDDTNITRYYLKGTGFVGGTDLCIPAEQAWFNYDEAVHGVNTVGTNQIFQTTMDQYPSKYKQLYVSFPQIITSRSAHEYSYAQQTLNIWSIDSNGNIVQPDAGWYRILRPLGTNTSLFENTARKYWNGTAFEGTAIYSNEILVNYGTWSMQEGSGAIANACSTSSKRILFFSNNGSDITDGSKAAAIMNTISTRFQGLDSQQMDATIYSYKSYNTFTNSYNIGTTLGKYALEKVRDISEFNDNPVIAAVGGLDSGNYDTITSSSKILGNQLNSCPVAVGPYFSKSSVQFSTISSAPTGSGYIQIGDNLRGKKIIFSIATRYKTQYAMPAVSWVNIAGVDIKKFNPPQYTGANCTIAINEQGSRQYNDSVTYTNSSNNNVTVVANGTNQLWDMGQSVNVGGFPYDMYAEWRDISNYTACTSSYFYPLHKVHFIPTT